MSEFFGGVRDSGWELLCSSSKILINLVNHWYCAETSAGLGACLFGDKSTR